MAGDEKDPYLVPDPPWIRIRNILKIVIKIRNDPQSRIRI